jgi:bifunctional UDP-N-acetylglucosamine pyrophosphorylase/glucosamine-1-phosphate N-acetyltransferase
VRDLAIILAAGEGKRMKSDLPKVLHEVAGEPLLAHVGRSARAAGVDHVVVVVGKGSAEVRAAFARQGWEFVEQPERLGTGDAVRRAQAQLDRCEGDVVILAGDAPLIRAETLATLRERHRAEDAAVSVLTARIPDPYGYGRICRDADGAFTGIVEEKDATEAQRAIDEVNSSTYCFRAGELRSALARVGSDNAQGEVYLTDAVGILHRDGKRVIAVAAASPEEILGVNTREQLEEIRRIHARRAGARREAAGAGEEGSER